MEYELKQSYAEYNGLLFSGILPEMRVDFRDCMYGEGSFECILKETKMPYEVVMVEGTGSIEISRSCDNWRGVLLHEMVHAYMATVGLGRELHGPRFQAKCQRIEIQLGLVIPRPKA